MTTKEIVASYTSLRRQMLSVIRDYERDIAEVEERAESMRNGLKRRRAELDEFDANLKLGGYELPDVSKEPLPEIKRRRKA
jgi:hypothetical protein